MTYRITREVERDLVERRRVEMKDERIASMI